jgi:hypothetical protein
VVWPPWPTSASTLSRISSPQNPKTWGGSERLHRLCGAENTQREKVLRQAEICLGEIVAIVIAIELDFIEIIIIIITTITSTFITIITTPSCCNILG